MHPELTGNYLRAIFTQSKMKIRSLKTKRTLSILFLVAMAGCTGLPKSTDANPEFRKQMEGKTIGEATGNSALWGQTEDSIAKKVFPGKTNKSDVRVIFGSADNVALSDTGEIWTYESSVVTIFSGASYTRNKLLILFDENGVVKRYSMNVDAR